MPRSVLCLPKKSHTHQTNVWPNFFVNIVLISIKEFIFDTHNCSRSTNQSTKAIQCSCSMLFNTESDRLSGIVTNLLSLVTMYNFCYQDWNHEHSCNQLMYGVIQCKYHVLNVLKLNSLCLRSCLFHWI